MKIKELTAAEITNKALQILALRKARVRRVNNIPVRRRKNTVEPGWSDIQGYSSTAVMILCEVKKIGDELSQAQIERLADLKKCGGISLIATQDKQTREFILKEFTND